MSTPKPLYVYERNRFLATLTQQSANADAYVSGLPWLLLHFSGRIDRFATLSEARAEALKSYAGSTFSRR